MGALCISPDCSVSLKLFQNTKYSKKKKLEVFLMASMDKVTNIKKKRAEKNENSCLWQD